MPISGLVNGGSGGVGIDVCLAAASQNPTSAPLSTCGGGEYPHAAPGMDLARIKSIHCRVYFRARPKRRFAKFAAKHTRLAAKHSQSLRSPAPSYCRRRIDGLAGRTILPAARWGHRALPNSRGFAIASKEKRHSAAHTPSSRRLADRRCRRVRTNRRRRRNAAAAKCEAGVGHQDETRRGEIEIQKTAEQNSPTP